MQHRLLAAFFLALVWFPAHAAPLEPEVYLEDMTWMEVRARIQKGATTVILPSGGTEQNGPHLVIGKHNYIVHYTAGEIARQVGGLAAPVIPFSPAGRITPPEGHMRFPGTISVSETTFAAVVEDAARSLKQHGFRLICLVGDHGGSMEAQDRVAEKLTAEWRDSGVRVINISDYYGKNGQEAWVAARNLKVGKSSAHAGFSDTSEMMSLKPEGIRKKLVGNYTEDQYLTSGASGDARPASAEHGKKLLSLKVDAAVEQIRNAQNRR